MEFFVDFQEETGLGPVQVLGFGSISGYPSSSIVSRAKVVRVLYQGGYQSSKVEARVPSKV